MKDAMGKLLSSLALVGAMALASEVILAAVFWFSGAVTPEKARDITKVLQGTLASPPAERAAVEKQAEMEHGKIDIDSPEALIAAVSEWEAERKAQQEDLVAQRQAIDSAARELESERAAIDASEKALKETIAAFAGAKAADEAAAREKGFQDAVATYAAMDAKDVAQTLFGLDDLMVVRYLKAFKTPFRAEVLTEIKKIDDANPGRPLDAPSRAAKLQEIMGVGLVATAAEAGTAPR